MFNNGTKFYDYDISEQYLVRVYATQSAVDDQIFKYRLLTATIELCRTMKKMPFYCGTTLKNEASDVLVIVLYSSQYWISYKQEHIRPITISHETGSAHFLTRPTCYRTTV